MAKTKKNHLKITWPYYTFVIKDTIYVLFFTLILSGIIHLWVCGIDKIVNWITSML